MEAILIISSILLLASGVIFSVLPPLPGPLLSYASLVTAHYISADTTFSTTSFVIWGVLALIVTVADYALPIAATKKFGGTKAGVIGGMIGIVAGLVLPIPFGIIIGPLLGAIIGDLYGGNHIRSAFKSGFGSFLGFMVATSIKILFSLILGGVVVYKVGEFTVTSILNLF
ncbi:MAG: DUF456 domain-containing protein [Cyclobacteriaceae bacterium]